MGSHNADIAHQTGVLYIVEKLDWFALLMLHGNFINKKDFRKHKISYIDIAASIKPFLFLFRWLDFEKLIFSSSQLYSAQGSTARLWVHYQEMNVLYQEIEKKVNITSEARNYIFRKILPGCFVGHGSGLWRNMYIMEVYLSKQRENIGVSTIVLILKKHQFLNLFQVYVAKKHRNIEVISSGFSWSSFKSFGLLLKLLVRLNLFVSLLRLKLIRNNKPNSSSLNKRLGGGQLAVNNITHINLGRADLHSDFFFLQNSGFDKSRIQAIFEAVSEEDYKTKSMIFKQADIGTIALGRSSIYANPIKYIPSWIGLDVSFLISLFKCCKGEERWLKIETEIFNLEKKVWRELLQEHHISVYLTWYKYSEEHCVVGSAIKEIGGLMAMYQRSYEGNASVETRVVADVMFGFSKYSAEIESLSCSNISHFVVTGYLGDHRFPLVKQEAKIVREQLKKRGCQHIIAFFDENSLDDSRWFIGHEVPRYEYAFLLNKLLQDSSIGLVLKPKNPGTLRTRLGEKVVRLLNLAIKTGRCYLYGESESIGSSPPSQAALSADVAIHSSLVAGTAGVEAILAGVPTVFMDDECFTMSPFYTLGKGKNVFNSWNKMWDSLECYLKEQPRDKKFGRFPEMMDHFDPFRDGRAAERMGTYLQWVIEEFERGGSRDDVLELASRRYCEAWGDNKVIELRMIE